MNNNNNNNVGLLLILFSVLHSLILCCSLNNEGLALLKLRERVVSDPYDALRDWIDEGGVLDHCSWFGVECSSGKVIILNLKDLCLGGTLAPEIRNLVHLKSIVLRNNSFTGVIPEGTGMLKELEVLDFGYNNFSGPLPPDLGSNLSLAILLLDNNGFVGSLSPEIDQLKTLSEFQVDENQLSVATKVLSCNKRSNSWNVAHTAHAVNKRQLQVNDAPLLDESASSPPSEQPTRHIQYYNRNFPLTRPPPPPFSVPSTPNVAFPPSPGVDISTEPPAAPTFREPNATFYSVNGSNSSSPSPLSPSPSNGPIILRKSSSNHHTVIIVGAVGGILILLILIIGRYICKTHEATVKPWATGLSGQLQKAFVTGVPKLKRPELEAGCEDFSNIIGSSPIGTMYKGTLSSGVEIAVASIVVSSAKDWSKNMEVQFRKKIETLSKVNHKNFVNLIGYCEEEQPFTRMMVFEYAPNGTLFEHLHIKESEHLNWGMRLRVAMGMAYCLKHMHQLNPAIAHNNLNSSAVLLTEDYAVKIADFSFTNEITATEMEGSGKKLPDMPLIGPESNVYSFGILLFEMVTGRLPYSVDNGSLEDWASDYLSGDQTLKKMVDPTLESFGEEKLERIGEVIKACVHPDPRQRPTMIEVTATLREITGITPDAATPKLSPLWWAELEIASAEVS